MSDSNRISSFDYLIRTTINLIGSLYAVRHTLIGVGEMGDLSFTRSLTLGPRRLAIELASCLSCILKLMHAEASTCTVRKRRGLHGCAIELPGSAVL